MKNTNIKKGAVFFIMMAAVFIQSGCSKDDDPVIYPAAFNGSQQAIENFLTPELTQTMTDLGLEINTGNTPPLLNGEYLFSIMKLQNSNISTDVIDSNYADNYMTFLNQNNSALTINFSYDQPSAGESGTGTGTLLSGTGNKFSAFLKQKVTNAGKTADAVIVISGTKTAEGFVDFQEAIFMLDNHGNTNFIANGKGRLFYDADGLVALQ